MAQEFGAKQIIKKIRHNHSLMMAICCGVPLLILITAVYIFGLNKSYLFWFIIILCPVMHYFMMKDMFKEHKAEKENN